MPPAAEPEPTTPPTIADVLRAIASADGKPWFPSEFATATGGRREDLSGPLNDLRVNGLIEVVDWMRGRGQGYGLTAEGRKALHLSSPVALPGAKPRASEVHPNRLTPYERGELAIAALFSPRPAVVTPVLVAVIVLWFLAGLGLAVRDGTGAADYLRGANSIALVKLGAVTGPSLLRGEWWRLGSCVFVHIGLLHIAVNLYALSSIGPLAEGLWGRWRFLLIFFGAGLAGSAAAVAVRPDVALAGASAAVWGVLASVGAWLVLFGNHFPPDHIAELARRLLYAVAINALISLAPGVSWEAHLGGGVAGFCVALLAHLVRPGIGWPALAAAAALVFLPLAFAAGLKRVIDKSNAWARLRYLDEQRQQSDQSPVPTMTAQIRFPAYPRAADLFREATIATIQGSTEKLDAVRAKAGQLKGEAVAARSSIDALPAPPPEQAAVWEKAKTYLDALVRFAVDVEEMTAPDRVPDPAKAAARGQRKKSLEAAWKALVGS